MIEWKKLDNGKSALLIEGARRVGKSYIAEKFAQNEYKSYILIDFATASEDIKELFRTEGENLDNLFAVLSAVYKTKLYMRESVIVFDEVQMCPEARQMIKYLVKDGRYDYIETGSLITLKRNIKNIVIPSEEERIQMFPLDFEEFLWAMGDQVTYTIIRGNFETKKPMGQALHKSIMKQFRQYMLVGGMPQVVEVFARERNFQSADRIKNRIIRLYKDDVAKFAEGYESKVYAIFDDIPGQLSKKEKK